jgi:sulfonate transport system ATP-binding protein
MFQDPRLLPWLTVEENLALALPRPRNKAEKAEVHNEIHRALALTGLADRAASRPGELSGGMAQRAALARCLCRNPDVLLLDEPLSSLDAVTRLRLREELERLWQQLGLTVIMVTHDIEEAVFFGEQVFLINQGAMESTMPIPLKRPRDYHGAEFHEYCRRIEEELCRNPVSQP